MRELLMSAYSTGAERWAITLLDATLKGVVLLAIAGLITMLLRRAPAATRHFVWTVAISALVVLPVMGTVAPRWNLMILPAAITPSSVTPSSTVPSSATTGTRPDAVTAPVPSTATPNAPPKDAPLASPRKEITKSSTIAEAVETAAQRASSQPPAVSAAESSSVPEIPAQLNWWLIASMVWLAGAALLALRMVIGLLSTSRLARRSDAVEESEWISLTNRLCRQLGITRPVTLLRSNRSGIPMTWGVFYPVILLPDDADEWTEERRQIVLLHELAHVRRFDALTQTIAHLAGAVFWINPLVWVAARQMRTERERACDDFVLTAGMRPSAYASDLLEIVRTMGTEPRMAYAALAMARRSEFEGRLLAILDPKARRKGMGGAGKLATVLAGLMLVVSLAGMRPMPRLAASIVAEERKPVASPVRDAGVTRPSAANVAVAVDSGDLNEIMRDAVGVMGERVEDLVARSARMKAAAEEAAISTEPLPEKPALVLGADLPRDDKQTLILVVRAAAKMTSDYEKASLLIEVLEKFVADDSLRMAFLATTAGLTSDYERQRVLSALLDKDPLSEVSRVAFIRVAASVSSDYSRRTILAKFAATHELTSPTVRDAFFKAVYGMSSGYDQQQLLVALVKRVNKLGRDEALGLLASAKAMSSSSNKSAVLVAVAEKIGLNDEQVRKAYIDAASTLSSDSEYRKVMSAAIKTTPETQEQ